MIVAEIFVNLVLQLLMQGIILGLGQHVAPPPPPSPPAIHAPAGTGVKSPAPLKKAEPLLIPIPAEESPAKEPAQSP